MKKAFITGITGQDGSYLADHLLAEGYQVHGLVRRSSSFNSARIDHCFDQLQLHYGDLTDGSSLARLLSRIAPDEIYNLGAQSHVRVSFDAPEFTFDVGATGTLRLLEAIRETEVPARYYQASSSEMFGKVAEIPQRETTPFYPRSPYAVAKVAAYWHTVNYREAYGLHASNGILFNHESITPSTPCIYSRNGIVGVAEIQDLVPHRKDPKHGKRYTTCPDDLKVWDRGEWVKVLTATAHWESNKSVRRVNCRAGLYEATDDHISFRADGGETPTGDLAAGDRLALGVFPDAPGNTGCTPEEAELLGMLMADGSFTRRGRGHFTKRDDVLRQRASYLWRRVTGGYTSDSYGSSGFGGADVPRINLNGASAHASLYRDELYDTRRKKRVPARILGSDSATQLCFLRGYNKCDGLKKGGGTAEFKSFSTNSAVAAQGLWWLCANQGLQVTSHPGKSRGGLFYVLNIRSPDCGGKGKHLQRPLDEIKSVTQLNYTGWLFDFETTSGTFSAGVGQTWIHNSPRRGETFVTRKITRAVARIKYGLEDRLLLGNREAKRDWGHAEDYVRGMHLMLQQDTPDDYVLATGETHSVQEFVERCFAYAKLPHAWSYYVGFDERYLRPTEVDLLLGDATKARTKLGWRPKFTFEALVADMMDADLRKACKEAQRR